MLAEERYRPKALHRIGGMAVLWIADDCVLEREVCLKVVRADADLEMHQQFEREAKIGGRLRHPNIVPVHDFGSIEWPDASEVVLAVGRVPHLFLAQTFIEGTDLKGPIDVLKIDRRAAQKWSRRSLLSMFMRVLDGMAYAHDQGVIHRDLKPSNILFDPRLHFVYIVDWGLAKCVGEREVATDSRVRRRCSPDVTMPGTIKGTPHYVSPEQARGEVDSIDSRSDIYSLGVMLYQLLTYELPIHDDDALTLVDRIGNNEPVPPPRERLERMSDEERMADPIPGELDEIVMHCLAKDPGERYQTAGELAEALEAHLMHDVPQGKLATFEPGTVLIREGEAAGDLFYLISGEVVIERDGQEIGRTTEGWIGTVGMLSGRRSATVRTATACRAHVFTDMTHPKLVETIRKDPAMAMGLMEDLARNLVDTTRRLKP